MTNINKASAKDLQKIKFIGPKLADAIIAGRPYKDIYELSTIKGIGKAKMEHFISSAILEI